MKKKSDMRQDWEGKKENVNSNNRDWKSVKEPHKSVPSLLQEPLQDYKAIMPSCVTLPSQFSCSWHSSHNSIWSFTVTLLAFSWPVHSWRSAAPWKSVNDQATNWQQGPSSHDLVIHLLKSLAFTALLSALLSDLIIGDRLLHESMTFVVLWCHGKMRYCI